MTLYTNGERVSIPMELVPLGSKDANTLATALDNALRYIGACAFPVSAAEQAPGSNGEPASSGARPATSGGGPASSGVRPVPASSGATGPDRWFLHIILGDGIATNEAAVKTLWIMVVRKPIGPRVKYFAVVLVCAGHTASLATGSVVQGRAAALGDHNHKSHETICGVVVRLFKYVLPDYWGEIVHATKEWVRKRLIVLSWEDRDPESEGRVQQLQRLYSKHVISDRCCKLLNGGLNPPTHVCAEGVDPETARPELVTRFCDYMIREL